MLDFIADFLYTTVMKAWIRTIKSGKAFADTIAEISDFSAAALVESLRDALLPIDLPAPVVIEEKARHLVKFNVVRFKPDDFVENVNFDVMIIELLHDKKPPHKRTHLDEV